MKKILILYYSRTGNTEKMAKAVAEGAQSINGVSVELNFHIEPHELTGYDAIIVGAPTYRKEVPVDFVNLFEETQAKGIELKGKVGAAFGSYGWSGEAPGIVLSMMAEKFGMQTPEEPLLIKYIPDEAALEASKNLGKKISETLMKQA
jgi:flavodoxin I